MKTICFKLHYQTLDEELTTSMQDFSTGFPQTQPLYTKISRTEFHTSKVHSSRLQSFQRHKLLLFS
jgi:hypothetical protein